MRKAGLSLIVLASVCTVAVLSAGPVSLGGKVWPYYSHVLAPEADAGYNEFGVGRVYFGIKGDLNDYVGARVTFDFKRLEKGYLHVYVKYAYVEFKGFLEGFKLRLGQNALPWVGAEEKHWKFRYVDKVMPDLAKKLTSTDVGVSALYKIPSGYGDAHLSYCNGAGYHAAETNKYKEIHGRLTIVPMPNSDALKGLKISGGYSGGTTAENVDRSRVLGNLAYGYDFLSVGATYMSASDDSQDTLGNVTTTPSSGLSAYAAFDVGKLVDNGHWGLFGKYDAVDPNTDAPADDWTKIVGGVFWNVTKVAKLAFDVSQKSFSSGELDSENETSLNLHTEVNFKL